MQKEQLSFDTINQQQAVFGPEDKYIKLIENSFHVSIVGRDSMLEVAGESEIDVNCVKEVLECMKQLHCADGRYRTPSDRGIQGWRTR